MDLKGKALSKRNADYNGSLIRNCKPQRSATVQRFESYQMFCLVEGIMENLEYIQGWRQDLVTISFLWVYLSWISPLGQYQTLTPYTGDCKKLLVDGEMCRWFLISQDHKGSSWSQLLLSISIEVAHFLTDTFCTWSQCLIQNRLHFSKVEHFHRSFLVPDQFLPNSNFNLRGS